MPTQHWIVRDNVAMLFVREFDRLRSMGYAWTGSEELPFDIRTEDLWEDEKRQMLAIEDEIHSLLKGFRVAQLEDEHARAAYEEVRDYVLVVYRAFFFGQTTSMIRRYVGTMMNRCQLGLRQMLEMHDPLPFIHHRSPSRFAFRITMECAIKAIIKGSCISSICRRPS